MLDEVAGFVQDAGDMDRVRGRAVENDVPRGEDPAHVLRNSVPAGPQVHGASQAPEFGPLMRSREKGSCRISSNAVFRSSS